MGASPQATAGPKIDPGQDAPGLTAAQVDFLVSVANQVEARRRARAHVDVAALLTASHHGNQPGRYAIGFIVDCHDMPEDADRAGCPGHQITLADLTGAIVIGVRDFVGSDEGRGAYRVKARSDCGVCRIQLLEGVFVGLFVEQHGG